jgi:ankyrin repeat protein
MRKLLQAKIDVNTIVAKYNGKIALHVVAKGKHLDVMKRLLQAKANVNAIVGAKDGKIAL